MIALNPTATTLADRIVTRSLVSDIALVTAGVALVALLARVEIPMWPVPISGQTLAVLLVGATLGARRAVVSMTAYMLVGLAGAPVFAGGASGPAYLLAPSFGFILGFIPAVAFIGWLAERTWDRRPLLALAGFLGASVIPFLIGVPYLGFMLARLGLAHDPVTLWTVGVAPFLVGGAVKWLIAASLLPLAWRGVRTWESRIRD
ncbi:biotin transporter BioY [Microbacterium sp. 179-B 1A2 NHS]|uniref:biotin transporter BioY n=1 Tax=Microbacterium sp. 179-B 1A2 NHS TaxID=3142383 RepID=UPI0039A1F3FD